MDVTTRMLGDICDEAGGTIRTGPFGSQLHQSDYQADGVPVVMPKDIIDGSISTEDIARVGEQHVERLYQHKLEVGDIVYGRRGDIGRHALVTEREAGWLCGTGCLRISLEDAVLDPVFLHYYLYHPEIIGWIYNQAIGATMPNLNTTIIRSIPITYPSIENQRRIAAILSSYDDLIENNTQRIHILEDMAQSLYREWFVYFRFPGYEDVPLVESELGPIPAGWEIKPFGEVTLNFDRMRVPLSSIERADRQGEFPYYGASGIIDYIDDYIFEGRYLLVAEDGENLRTRKTPIAFFASGQFWVNNHAHILQGKPPVSSDFLYLFMADTDISGFITGAAQPKLSQANLNRIPIKTASELCLRHFDNIVQPIFAEVELLDKKNAVLREARDLLLPRLVSGEIDVSELEIELGAIDA
jgi:type I restriction enzyme S subunit